MALVRPYTDAYGNDYPESYWRVGFLSVTIPDRTARTELHCYKDQAAYADGKRAIVSRGYDVSGDDFLYYMYKYQSGEVTDLFGLAYVIALETRDTPDGEGGLVSFFANAKQV